MENFRKPNAYKSINSNVCISLKEQEPELEPEQKIINDFTTFHITMMCCLMFCFNIFLNCYL